ncbi:Lrp/AsnC family transcriptional regulator [Stackebrandtia nassauensis]|uniref:Transcriptional regulator, AsnC family n=1 Tax=Stackebrandtia nassauensis (strain DSM 44728 / CIP 108903 / NRRL B-16338 / NBRC 102104 / LLR-40K-21) TaxID=446470 RepID=D3Q825_STANL|nr:Lrp/AsnC family transcriptional regulator [Stackebrandtia nassauensis]ADD40530.1 transcriptional regulator, AsnC family [Stackebrandtia nassauensis DSM 44728]
MDDIDRRIVQLLQENARRSYAEMARQVGLTSPSVQERVAKLERNGVITAYRAEVNPDAVGLGITALIGIVTTAGAEYSDVAEAIEEIHEVESCYFMAGQESYLLKVRVGEMAELEHLVNRLNRLPGVGGTRTTVALSTKWEARPHTRLDGEP